MTQRNHRKFATKEGEGSVAPSRRESAGEERRWHDLARVEASAPMPFSVVTDISILVVDESAAARTATIDMLHGMGASRVRETGNAFEAIDILRHGNVDIVLAEWNPQLVRFIRAAPDPRLARLPVIMFHESHRDAEVQDALDAGVNELVAEPVERERLLGAILRLIEQRRPVVRTNGYSGPDRRGAAVVAADNDDDMPEVEVPPKDWLLTPEEIATLLRR